MTNGNFEGKSLENKLNNLAKILADASPIMVALSGGVDSTFLVTFAAAQEGVEVTAVTAEGPHFAADEVAYAKSLCEELGVAHKSCDISYVLNEIKHNPQDRCYHCKKAIFTSLQDQAKALGATLMDGTNLDDMSDYRPGIKALKELGIVSPLKEAGLKKAEIREALRQLTGGEGIWRKPAFACLASRIPYGQEITVEKLKAVYEAEMWLMANGFTQFRARCYEKDGGLLARIELLPEEMPMMTAEKFAEAETAIKKAGFGWVELDPEGYRMGKLNDKIKKTGESDEI